MQLETQTYPISCQKPEDLAVFLINPACCVSLPHHSRIARNWHWMFGVERVWSREETAVEKPCHL